MQLSKEVEKAFKREIKYAKDCDELSYEIYAFTNKNISSSTLRRVFGLLKSTSNLSKYNENTLLDYIEEKKKIVKQSKNNDLSLQSDRIQHDFSKLKLLHNGLNEHLLVDIIESNIHPNKTFKLLQFAVLEALEKEDIDFFIVLYRQNKIIISNVLFFRFFGTQLKNKPDFAKELLPHLAKEKNVRRYFFELFVDFSNFKSYEFWLDTYYHNEPNYTNKLWALSLKIYGNVLSEVQHNLWNDYFELLKLCKNELEVAHPYLKARVYGVALFHEETATDFSKIIFQELKNNYTEMMEDESYNPHFPDILCQYALLNNSDLDTISLLFKIFKTHLENNSWLESHSAPFYLKLCECKLNNSKISLDQIKNFRSDHTNEDTPIKLCALQYVKPNERINEAKKYKEALIQASGFTYFNQEKMALPKIDEVNE
ncbi:MAG: hypothetical protein ACI9C9_001681, partial [Marivirga sp.]